MRTCFFIAVSALLALVAAPTSAAETIGQGYTCSVSVLSTIGGWDGVGEAELSMFVDANYQPVSTTLKYNVRDRVTGFGKFLASWPVNANGAFLATGPGNVRIPIRADVPDDFSIIVTLDGANGVTHRFHRAGKYVTDLDAIGFAARGQQAPVVNSEADHPWLPDLRGHRTLSIDIRYDGAPRLGDTFLLPDWQAAEEQVSRAFRTAEKLRRQHRCDQTFILRPNDQQG